MSGDLFAALRKPFHAEEVEWRIGQSGKTRDGKIWAKAFAYVTNRAIQNRLDEVVGPGNWQCDFRVVEGGFLCGIGINTNGHWVWKWDGAERTDFEPLKGGLSGSMKRAAVQWGMGRYLYELEEGWCEVSESRQEGWEWAKTKDGDSFYWAPPRLPAWALPEGEVVGPGPQRGPATVPQIEAQTKQVQRELMDSSPAYEPPKAQRQFGDEKPACPECGETKSVRFVARDKRKPGEPICYCWKREGGCGAKFDPPNTPSSDPHEGAQVPPKKDQEPMDSFDAWARVIVQTPVGAEAASIKVITKAFEEKRLTSEYVYQIIERATQMAMTTPQGEVIEVIAGQLKDACKLPERGKFGWLNFGELFPVMFDRIEQGGGKEVPF